MKKLATLTGVIALAALFGGAVTKAYATHPAAFCLARPLHPHCSSAGGLPIIGDFIAPFLAFGTCTGSICVGVKVGQVCTFDNDCVVEVDGSGGINSIGLWFVDTPGLASVAHDICFIATRLDGFLNGTLVVKSLNDQASVSASGILSHKGSLNDPAFDLGTVIDPAILIFEDASGSLSCGFHPPSTEVQATGLTFKTIDP